MDFATRDRYRHVIEKLAKTSPLSEVEVARCAIQLAQAKQPVEAALPGGGARETHVGFYLIDQGLRALEAIAQVRFSLSESLAKIVARRPLAVYLGAIALLTLIFSAGLLALAQAQEQSQGLPQAMLVPIGLLALLATSQLALALVNWLATLLVRPHLLPRMDFSSGIPPQSRTLVVVPTMLSDARSVDDLTEALEVRFLANRDANLYFGLLTDFRDAAQETLRRGRAAAAPGGSANRGAKREIRYCK